MGNVGSIIRPSVLEDNGLYKKSEEKKQFNSPIVQTALLHLSSPKIGEMPLKSLYGKVSFSIKKIFPHLPKKMNLLISSYIIPCLEILENHVRFKNYQMIAKDFQEIRRQKIELDEQTYVNLLYVLIDEKLSDDAWIIFRLAINDGIILPEESYSGLLNLFIEKWDEEKICKIFVIMTRRGMKPQTKTLNFLIALYFKIGKGKLASTLFQELKNRHKRPSRLSYNLILNFYIRTKNKSEVINIFNEMRSNNIKLDRINTLILSESFFFSGMI